MERAAPKYLPTLMLVSAVSTLALVAGWLMVMTPQAGLQALAWTSEPARMVASITTSLAFYGWLILSARRVYVGGGKRVVWMALFTLLSATFVAGAWASQFPSLRLAAAADGATRTLANIDAYQSIKCHYRKEGPCAQLNTEGADAVWLAALDLALADQAGRYVEASAPPDGLDNVNRLLSKHEAADKAGRAGWGTTGLMLTSLDAFTKDSAFNQVATRLRLAEHAAEVQVEANRQAFNATLPLMLARDIVTFGN